MMKCDYLDSLGWMSLLRPSLATEWINRVFCQLSPEDAHTQTHDNNVTDDHLK